MWFRERQRQSEDTPQASAPAAGPGGGNLEEIRRAAQALTAAGDEAIRRALSSNSEAFLDATRQQGGQ